MILFNELTLTTPILGCKVVEGRPRALLKQGGDPGLIREVWQQGCTKAACDLNIKYSRQAIRFPGTFKATAFTEYVRVYNKLKKERFEAIPKGAKITFECLLDTTQLLPTDYAKIIKVVGQTYGVSQWGSKFGYGRFDVTIIRREKLDVKLDFEIDI